MSQFLSYSELLVSPTWREKRQQILHRDNYKCTKCGKKQKIYIKESYNQHEWRLNQRKSNVSDELELYYLKSKEQEFLQVHHVVYRTNVCPVLQDNNDLITLCRDCHEKHHERHELVVIDKQGNKIEKAEICNRCGGKGYIPKYWKVQNGICFKCWGNSYVLQEKFLKWDRNEVGYPGINENLTLSESGILKTIRILNEYSSLKNFDIFLDKLHAVIELLQVSTFDDRFLILLKPFPHDSNSSNYLVKVRIGIETFQSFPLSENNSQVFGVNFWEPIDIRERFKDIQKQFNEEEVCNLEWISAEADFFNSRDFKDRHNQVIYKMAINYDFRLKIFKELNLL